MSLYVLILAAGKGKRMCSSIPKVLTPLGGRAMIFYIVDRVFEVIPGAKIAVVVGHQADRVEAELRKEFPEVQFDFIQQGEPLGTGHAARVAMDSAWGKKATNEKASVLVLPGDLPLITEQLVREMTAPLTRGVAFRMLTAVLPNPQGYGRVVRKSKRGEIIRIAEERDANEREKQIQEVALAIYFFHAAFLAAGARELKNNNAQKEYYLPDLVRIASQKKRTIDAWPWSEIEDIRGVNDPLEWAEAAKILNQRAVRKLALQGVKFIDTGAVYIQPSVKIATDVTIYPGVILEGKTEIAEGAVLGPNVFLKDVSVGRRAEIKAGTVAEKSVIEENAKLGPYAHLRPDSVVGANSKIGNFVELKKTRVGHETSIAHLSYLGDAEVGARVNIGCGFVTCNFDGRVIGGERKHKTVIEDDVFVGSDCQTVAPVTLKRGSYVASGSTITETVESDSLAIARSRQVNKPGYARKIRGGVD